MNKVAIVTDSIASLPPGLASRFGIRVVPINIVYNRKIYRDGVDISTAETYRMLKENPELFNSSPASIAEYMQAFQEAARETDQILCITLSTKLSGMYNVARLAINQLKAQLPGVTVELMDSRTAATGEGYVVEKAAEAAAKGHNLVEVTRIARSVSEKIKVIGIMDTIRYVYRTGRVPKLAARFGASLNIRPLFLVEEGRVKIIGITRNQDNGIQRTLKMMRDDVGDRPVRVAVAHADNPEGGEILRQKIQSTFNCREMWTTLFSPIMAYATGEGVLSVGYYPDDGIA